MATTYGNQFANGAEVTTSAVKIYEVPATNVKAVVQNARAQNYSADQKKLTLWMLPATQVIGDNFKAVIERAIDPNETVLLSEIINEPIAQGGSIWVQADDAGIAITIGGSLETSS